MDNEPTVKGSWPLVQLVDGVPHWYIEGTHPPQYARDEALERVWREKNVMQTQSTAIKLLHGDCRAILPTLAPRSVQTIITSPPYFGLRDYGITPTAWPEIEYTPMPGLPSVTVPAQTVCLGLESDPLAYTAHLVHVFRLARPALADDGTAWLNLGDCYASNWPAPSNRRNVVGQGSLENGKREARPPRIGKGLKDKDLMLIPARVALALQADGWYVRNQAIWWKPNAMPESVTDRLTNDYEPLYLLAKSPRYYFDQAAIREPHKPESIKRAKYQLNIGQGGDAAVTGKRSGTWKNEQINHPDGRNRRAVWRISTEALRDEHYAPMPEALVEPCILAGSKPGDTVLDMFFGSGTVGRVALKYGRRCIGIDLNQAYLGIQERRTNGVQIHMEAYLSPNESEAA